MFSGVFKFFSLTHLWFTKVYDTAWKNPIGHYDFHKSVALAWIGQDAHWLKQYDDTERIDSKKK